MDDGPYDEAVAREIAANRRAVDANNAYDSVDEALRAARPGRGGAGRARPACRCPPPATGG